MRLAHTGAFALFLCGVSPLAIAAEDTSRINGGSSYQMPVTQEAPAGAATVAQPAAPAQILAPAQSSSPASGTGAQSSETTGSGDAAAGLPPGASKGTIPSTMSESVAAQDAVPIMARPLPLSDEQRQQILRSVKGAGGPVASINAKPADELPADIELSELPADIEKSIPAMRGLKYVRADDKILLVLPASRIVVGEITQ